MQCYRDDEDKAKTGQPSPFLRLTVAAAAKAAVQYPASPGWPAAAEKHAIVLMPIRLQVRLVNTCEAALTVLPMLAPARSILLIKPMEGMLCYVVHTKCMC
jgi:hypothetical protein